MIDLSLKANATFEQDLPPAYNGFFYVLDGSVQVGDDAIAASQVGWLAPSSSRDLVISAQDRGARLVLCARQPLGEPMTQQRSVRCRGTVRDHRLQLTLRRRRVPPA
jgi:hypothetical protein